MSTTSGKIERETSLGTLSTLSDELLIYILGFVFSINITLTLYFLSVFKKYKNE
jgi:hypothetical protein